MKIAEGLLLRKQLEAKVQQLQPIKTNGDNGLFVPKVTRVNVSENIDNVTMEIPKVTLEDITKEYDYYATELRKLDTAIQEANWLYELNYKEQKRK